MPQFHLRFDLPEQAPYDRQDWQWQAYGEIALPFQNTHRPDRLWIGCYKYPDPSIPKHLLIRYESEAKIEDAKLTMTPKEHTSFDVHAGLNGDRFLGVNQRKKDQEERGSLIFDLLSVASRLTLDQLSHKDKDGYWQVEQNQDQGNNHFGHTLESVHHLFCHVSAVPTAVVVIDPLTANQKQLSRILSPLYAKNYGVFSSNVPLIPVQY